MGGQLMGENERNAAERSNTMTEQALAEIARQMKAVNALSLLEQGAHAFTDEAPILSENAEHRAMIETRNAARAIVREALGITSSSETGVTP